jgi:arylsulfatase A
MRGWILCLPFYPSKLPPLASVSTVMRIFALSLAILCPAAAAAAETVRKPNIVFILADDLGYGDLGCYGQKIIRTPALDGLAERGMRFTRHYAGSPVCAPSRCVLMTGKHPGRAFVRDNREVGGWLSGEGQLPLPAGQTGIASLLKRAGYATGAFGKWGLGGVGTTGDPLKQGFDRFFGYNDQREAHNFYPPYLIDDDKRLELPGNAGVIRGGKARLAAGADPDDAASYATFSGKQYAPDLCNKRALDFIRANRERPFFLYYPTTVPHLALQVPEDSLAEYRGKLGDRPYDGSKGYLPHGHPRAAYAGMVTRMDRDIGRMVDLVRMLGLEEDTLFVFTSDNGGAFDIGGAETDFFRSNGYLRGYKGDIYEGGIRVPLVVSWKGRVPAGTSCDRVTGFEDWLPTLLELAGSAKNPEAVDGISFAKTLLGEEQPGRAFLYREFPGYGGQQSVHAGKWKYLRRNLIGGGMRSPEKPVAPTTELYDLEADPKEENNLAEKHPEVIAELAGIAERERVVSENFPFPILDE